MKKQFEADGICNVLQIGSLIEVAADTLQQNIILCVKYTGRKRTHAFIFSFMPRSFIVLFSVYIFSVIFLCNHLMPSELIKSTNMDFQGLFIRKIYSFVG